MDKVSEVLDGAEGLRQMILVGLHQAPAQGERIVLVGTYLDTVIEHHEAIALLIRKEWYGSAFALLPPVYDSVLRACWVNACATDDHVRQLCAADEHAKTLPRSSAFFSALDAAYGLNNQIQNLKGKFEAMCSYTHSGLRQLARRGFRGAKQHGYSPRAIIEVVDFATSGLASLARVYFAATGNGLWTPYCDCASEGLLRSMRIGKYNLSCSYTLRFPCKLSRIGCLTAAAFFFRSGRIA